jgi:5-bromo-4-chloroindolyl phosphate hydrolysis protein
MNIYFILVLGIIVVIIIMTVILTSLALRNSKSEDKIYKKTIEQLEDMLKRKKITKDDYELLRKTLEEQHQKLMVESINKVEE